MYHVLSSLPFRILWYVLTLGVQFFPAVVLVDPGKLTLNFLESAPLGYSPADSCGRAKGVVTVTIRGSSPQKKSQYASEFCSHVHVHVCMYVYAEIYLQKTFTCTVHVNFILLGSLDQLSLNIYIYMAQRSHQHIFLLWSELIN